MYVKGKFNIFLILREDLFSDKFLKFRFGLRRGWMFCSWDVFVIVNKIIIVL